MKWSRANRSTGWAVGARPLKGRESFVYVIGFTDILSKVGKTTNWALRKKALTHNGGFKLTGEARFRIEFEQNLTDAENVALEAMRAQFKTAGGREFFKAPFDEAFVVVQRAIASAVEECIVGDVAVDRGRGPALSETTGDQLDSAIRAFCQNHGIGQQKVIRFIGAGTHVDVIKQTGLIPVCVEERMRLLMDRPAVLFEVAS